MSPSQRPVVGVVLGGEVAAHAGAVQARADERRGHVAVGGDVVSGAVSGLDAADARQDRPGHAGAPGVEAGEAGRAAVVGVQQYRRDAVDGLGRSEFPTAGEGAGHGDEQHHRWCTAPHYQQEEHSQEQPRAHRFPLVPGGLSAAGTAEATASADLFEEPLRRALAARTVVFFGDRGEGRWRGGGVHGDSLHRPATPTKRP